MRAGLHLLNGGRPVPCLTLLHVLAREPSYRARSPSVQRHCATPSTGITEQQADDQFGWA